MSRAREREEFLVVMSREGVPLDVARRVMRHGATLHRIAEIECSSEAADRDRIKCHGTRKTSGCACIDYGAYDNEQAVHGWIPRIAVQEERLRNRVAALLAPYNVTAVFSGDPRGAVVKLKVPSGHTDDCGQTGVCVP